MIYNDPNFFKKKQYTVTISSTNAMAFMYASPRVTINETTYAPENTAAFSEGVSLVVDQGTVIHCQTSSNLRVSTIYVNGAEVANGIDVTYDYIVQRDADILLNYMSSGNYSWNEIHIDET